MCRLSWLSGRKTCWRTDGAQWDFFTIGGGRLQLMLSVKKLNRPRRPFQLSSNPSSSRSPPKTARHDDDSQKRLDRKSHYRTSGTVPSCWRLDTTPPTHFRSTARMAIGMRRYVQINCPHQNERWQDETVFFSVFLLKLLYVVWLQPNYWADRRNFHYSRITKSH